MMTTTHSDMATLAATDVVVLDYLAALWAEADDLSPELRDDLMTTVADYIAVRRTAGDDPLADPEQIIGRLGPPEALVASVRRGRMPAHLRVPVAPRTVPDPGPPVAGDCTAIALLTTGAFVLPGIGPLAGMLLVTGSARWTARQKAVAWALAATGTGCGLLLLMVATFGTASAFPVFIAYLVMIAGSTAAGVSLLPGLSRSGPRPPANRRG
jgi:HAAS domain-containing protein